MKQAPRPAPLYYRHVLLVHPCHPPLDLYQAHRDVVAALRAVGWIVVGSGAK